MLDTAHQSDTNGPLGSGPEAFEAGQPRNGLGPATWAFEIQHLNVFFGARQVIKDISLQIPCGTLTAIIGPNGCGKSTLLRVLNRLHDLTPEARIQGQVRLFGREIFDSNIDPLDLRRRIGMVFQKPNPFPNLSVAQNVTAGLRLGGVRDRTLLQERLEHSLRAAALWEEVKDRLNSPAVSLSSGQQQRLCLARALALNPEVLLMDEPASALDPIATARIEDVIFELKKRLTILIVTHNLQQAARISEYTAFIHQGELIEYDTTQRIFTSPRKRATEQYVTGRFG